MPHNRFYLPGPLEGEVVLKDDEHHHLKTVMRVQENQEIELVNGKWTLAKAVVTSIGKKETRVRIEKTRTIDPPKKQLTIAIPYLKFTSMEYVIEKCTEVGAHKFWLYPSENSEKRSLSMHQVERLRRFTIAAMKQCGRLDLPHIELYSDFKSLPFGDSPIYFGDLSKEAKHYAPIEESCHFCFGPEKGFTAAEIQHLWEEGIGISLGPHILRAETAPLVFSALYYAPCSPAPLSS